MRVFKAVLAWSWILVRVRVFTPRRIASIILITSSILALAVPLLVGATPRENIIPFHTIILSQGDGGSQAESIVINDQQTWSRVWIQRICSGSNPCLPSPQATIPYVNFTLRTVLAVFMGQQPNEGYAVRITKVTQAGSTIFVDVLYTKQGNCGEPERVVQPFHFADIPKIDLPVVFRTTIFLLNC